MLQMVSCTLGHVKHIQTVMDRDPYAAVQMFTTTNCEHFMGHHWQSHFLDNYCTQVGYSGVVESDLIGFDFNAGRLPPPPPMTYRQLHACPLVTEPGVQEADITQVCPLDTTFTLSDLCHNIY